MPVFEIGAGDPSVEFEKENSGTKTWIAEVCAQAATAGATARV
jgi:hypothetical protein